MLSNHTSKRARHRGDAEVGRDPVRRADVGELAGEVGEGSLRRGDPRRRRVDPVVLDHRGDHPAAEPGVVGRPRVGRAELGRAASSWETRPAPRAEGLVDLDGLRAHGGQLVEDPLEAGDGRARPSGAPRRAPGPVPRAGPRCRRDRPAGRRGRRAGPRAPRRRGWRSPGRTGPPPPRRARGAARRSGSLGRRRAGPRRGRPRGGGRRRPRAPWRSRADSRGTGPARSRRAARAGGRAGAPPPGARRWRGRGRPWSPRRRSWPSEVAHVRLVPCPSPSVCPHCLRPPSPPAARAGRSAWARSRSVATRPCRCSR